jgi:CsoR family transcriptional regulator, copper-sensing transcriptional repressor
MGDCQNPDHRAELRRLSRIKGQIDGVTRMIDENRYCPDILVQTRAISAAVRSLETALLSRHLNHCVAEAFTHDDVTERESKTTELLEIFAKRLDR